MPLPRLSIITASLNHGKYIGAAVDSVGRLANITHEHLVIDGDSTDETHEVLAQRPHLDVHIMPGLDSHEALNYALGIVQGDIVGFLNSDDRYDPGVLEDVVAFFDEHPDVEVLCGGIRFFSDEDGGEQEVRRFSHVRGPDMMLELTFGNPGFNSWFFRTSTLRRMEGFRTYYRYAADRDLLLRLAAVTKPAVLPRLAYHYRVHIGSRTMDPRGTNRRVMILEHLRLVREQSEQVWRHDPAMLAMLAQWGALERFKLVVRGIKNYNYRTINEIINTPWLQIPAALAKRRRWLRDYLETSAL